MRNLPVGLIRYKIQLIFADNAIVPTAGCGGVTPASMLLFIRPQPLG